MEIEIRNIQNQIKRSSMELGTEIEIRNIQNQIKRSSEDSRTVEGLAVVFNSDSVDMGFIERISPNAITEDTINNSDIFAYLDHNSDRGVLARSRNGNGTLKLWLEEDGLHYRFEAPNTALGDELLSYLSRGEINNSSFAFTVAKDGDVWEMRNGKHYRTINNINRLFDVSPVFQPAYKTTTSVRRRLDGFAQIEEKLNKIKEEIEKL